MKLLHRLEKERLELQSEVKAALRSRVFQHGETLTLKKRQLVYKDHYGNEILDKFLLERDYFVKSVLTRDITQELWIFLFQNEEPAQLFHEMYNEYIQSGLCNSGQYPDLGQETTPLEFERFCCEILRKAGWEARTTRGSGDQGIDIIAQREHIKLVMQCKLFSRPVGNAAVQEIIAGRAFERASYAAVVTNASYTPAAIALAHAADVLLLNYLELQRLHVKLGLGQDADSVVQRALPSRCIEQPTAPHIFRPMTEIVQQAELLRCDLQEAVSPGDPLYEQAVEIVIKHRRASVYFIQEQLGISYNRSAKLLEMMERDGLVSEK